MAIDFTKLTRDLSDLAAAGTHGIALLKYGSFADRNPGLGPMKRCPHCHQRRRMFTTITCCNASHATNKRAWSPEEGFHQQLCEPRVAEAALPAGFMKRLLHKKHSNKLRHQIHDMALGLQNEAFRNTTQLLLEGLPGFHTPQRPVDLASIPAYAERVVRTIRKGKAHRKRTQQQESRQINRGLRAGLDGNYAL